jgi:prolyl-tRNA synthetase
MRMSNLFSRTLRETPSEADVISHQLLLRAGYIRQLAAGIFTYLPLGRRTLDKIEAIMRQEIDLIGGQEIRMPVVQPADLWQESGRWYKIDTEMGRFKDRSQRDMVLAMTHEEAVAELVRNEIRSYRQLPMLVYHIQTKWRDDPRPRAGLIRAREFTMKDSYSLDATWEGLDIQYQNHSRAYFNIFHRCNLPVISVKGDVGMMGGQMAHEFMYLSPIGEDTLLVCDQCGHSANRQIAQTIKPEPAAELLQPIEEVSTPGTKTIQDLARYLQIPESKTAKAVFMVASLHGISEGASAERSVNERFVFAIVRGDMEVNETKFARSIGAHALRPATEAEIQATGATPGYASPVGLKDTLVVVDDIIPRSPNLVAGANKDGFHLRNVNYGRDYQAEVIADITTVQDGDACPQCRSKLRAVRGVEVGNIFKLGTDFSKPLGCNFIDQDGQSKPVIMGSYGIGSGRLLACIAEEHHDERGLILPVTVAPFQVHLVALTGKSTPVADAGKDAPNSISLIANHLYEELCAAGIDVLYDDRTESPGVKFNDADLIGLPIRLTVSERAMQQGGVEFKRRDKNEKHTIPYTPGDPELISTIRSAINQLISEIDNRFARQ